MKVSQIPGPTIELNFSCSWRAVGTVPKTVRTRNPHVAMNPSIAYSHDNKCLPVFRHNRFGFYIRNNRKQKSFATATVPRYPAFYPDCLLDHVDGKPVCAQQSGYRRANQHREVPGGSDQQPRPHGAARLLVRSLRLAESMGQACVITAAHPAPYSAGSPGEPAP